MPSILTRNLRARSRCWRQFPTTLSDASTRTNFPASPLSIKSSGRSERFAVKWNERAELKGVLKRNQLRSTCFLGPCHTFDYFLNGSHTTSCSRPEKGNEMREKGRVWVQWVSCARPKPKRKTFFSGESFRQKSDQFWLSYSPIANFHRFVYRYDAARAGSVYRTCWWSVVFL